MGDWSITIVGSGPHHNIAKERSFQKAGEPFDPDEYDADVLLTKFIIELKMRGHNISHASFVSGSRDPYIH